MSWSSPPVDLGYRAVLGAVLARQVAHHTEAGLPVPAAHGEATGTVFAMSACVALLGIVAAILLKPVLPRTSPDLSKKD
jgi:hypothetical protein